MKDAATLLARLRAFVGRHRWELYVALGIIAGGLAQRAGYESFGFAILAMFALRVADHADDLAHAAIAGEG